LHADFDPSKRNWFSTPRVDVTREFLIADGDLRRVQVVGPVGKRQWDRAADLESIGENLVRFRIGAVRRESPRQRCFPLIEGLARARQCRMPTLAAQATSIEESSHAASARNERTTGRTISSVSPRAHSKHTLPVDSCKRRKLWLPNEQWCSIGISNWKSATMEYAKRQAVTN
jgi:hypothetical protein